MKKLLLLAALALSAAGCVSGRSNSGYGYFVTDDGFDGCAFRYGYYPYYDPYPSGALSPARMEIVRVNRVHMPVPIDRGAPWQNAGSREGISAVASETNDRGPVITA